MKKADFIKAFRNKSAWKKASAVIVLVDYKLEGKKTTVAIPFRKEAEMKAEMKRIKKEKLHLMKKTGGGSVSMENEGEDGMKAKIELKLGGLSPELLQANAAELFDKIKTTLEVLIAVDAEMEVLASGEAVDGDEIDEIVENITTETAVSTEPTGKKLTQETRAKMKVNMQKMQETLTLVKKQLKI